MDTRIDKLKDLLWTISLLDPLGLLQVKKMDLAGQYQGSRLTWQSGTWTFNITWVASEVHLYFLIASGLLLPRAVQLGCPILAITPQMASTTHIPTVAASMGTSPVIPLELFHTMVGAQLIPQTEKALELKRRLANWICMAAQGTRRCC